MTWTHPFPKSTITSRWGSTRPPRTSPHRGLDYAPGARELIPALTDGTVTAIFYSSVLGWVCEFKSDEHGIYVGHSHLYCNKHDTVDCDGKDHADATCMKTLKVGDKVSQGQWIGRVGNSGASRGSHLHLTMSKKPDSRFAKTFDPEKFIDQKEAHAIRQAKKAKEVTPPEPAAPAPRKPKPILHTLGIRMGRFWHFKK